MFDKFNRYLHKAKQVNFEDGGIRYMLQKLREVCDEKDDIYDAQLAKAVKAEFKALSQGEQNRYMENPKLADRFEKDVQEELNRPPNPDFLSHDGIREYFTSISKRHSDLPDYVNDIESILNTWYDDTGVYMIFRDTDIFGSLWGVASEYASRDAARADGTETSGTQVGRTAGNGMNFRYLEDSLDSLLEELSHGTADLQL